MQTTETGLNPPCPSAAWAGPVGGADVESFGRAMESCRQYLMLVADREIGADLRAKGGASDVVQETFLEAQRDLGRFRGQSQAELHGWLRQLLLNNIANFVRRYRRTGKRRLDREVRLEGPAEAGVTVPAAAPSPSQHAIRREQEAALAEALGGLPDHYRRAIVWRHQEGLSFEEIGQRLGGSAEAARKVWARAVERLRREVEGADRGGGRRVDP